MYLEGTLISIRWPSPDALTAAAGWSSTEHLSLISWWVRAADVTDGPTTSRPTPMVVKESFAFRVAVLATSIAGYDQLLFARAVRRFCIFIYNLSSSWMRRRCTSRKVAELRQKFCYMHVTWSSPDAVIWTHISVVPPCSYHESPWFFLNKFWHLMNHSEAKIDPFILFAGVPILAYQ